MSDEQLDKIINELDSLVKLTAVSILKDKILTERISTLLEFGFETKTIASLLGTKDNIVRAVKSRLAKGEKKPRAKTKAKATSQKAVGKTSEN